MGDNVASAEDCAQFCYDHPDCESFTYGKLEGQSYTRRCHLKDNSNPIHAPSSCCDSGYKNACVQYCTVQSHVGCHQGSQNMGYLGRPKDFLSDYNSHCTSGGQECVDVGERACESMSNCWGFAVHTGWGVQMYDSNAATCSGTEGLQANGAWTTYKRGACVTVAAEAETNSLAMSIVTPGETSSVVLHGLAAVGLLTTLYTVGRKCVSKSDKYEEIADDV